MRKIIVTAIVALAALFATASPAEATLALRISYDGGATFGAAITDGSNPGSIPSTAVGPLNITTSSTSFVSLLSTFLDLQVNGTAAASTYNLVVQASVDDISTFPSPMQTLTYAYTGSALGGSGLTVTMRSWVDDNNVLFGTGAIVADTGNVAVPAGGTIDFAAGVPYSATAEVRITGTNSQPVGLSLDNNNHITPTPAPAGLLLALSGGPALAVGAWLRRRRAAKVA